jgi:hypothetical protein
MDRNRRSPQTSSGKEKTKHVIACSLASCISFLATIHIYLLPSNNDEQGEEYGMPAFLAPHKSSAHRVTGKGNTSSFLFPLPTFPFSILEYPFFPFSLIIKKENKKMKKMKKDKKKSTHNGQQERKKKKTLLYPLFAEKGKKPIQQSHFTAP